MTLMRPPNAMPFRCRERAGRELQKTSDLGREAVNCNGLFGRKCSLLIYTIMSAHFDAPYILRMQDELILVQQHQI